MKEIQNYFLDKDIVFKDADPGVQRKILAHNESLMVCRLHFEKGAVGALHQHPHTQCTYIISGKFEFNIGGKKMILGPGDSTYKEPDVIHGAVCLEEGELLDIFTPERKDFLK